MYLCVSRHYCYHLRDEVVNEQFLVEEIYERELNWAETEHEKEKIAAELDAICTKNNTYCYMLYPIMQWNRWFTNSNVPFQMIYTANLQCKRMCYIRLMLQMNCYTRGSLRMRSNNKTINVWLFV